MITQDTLNLLEPLSIQRLSSKELGIELLTKSPRGKSFNHRLGGPNEVENIG